MLKNIVLNNDLNWCFKTNFNELLNQYNQIELIQLFLN